jgi:hypothetical protein
MNPACPGFLLDAEGCFYKFILEFIQQASSPVLGHSAPTQEALNNSALL